MTIIRSKSSVRRGTKKTINQFVFAFFPCLFVFSVTARAQFVDLPQIGESVEAHREWVTQLVAAPSGKELFSAGADGRVVFRDAASGKVLREVSLPSIVLTLSLSNDGQLLAAGDAFGTISLIETASGKIKNSFKADKSVVNASSFSGDGKFMAAGGSDGIVRIWSVADAKITGEINPARGIISALAFAGSQLVVGTINFKASKGLIEVWDWQDKKVVRTFDEGAPGFRAVSVSFDGKLLAVADFQPASLLSVLPVEGSGVEVSLRLLPDSDEVTPVAIWDLTSGKRAGLFDAETGARSIAFSPDGKMLACAGANGVIVYDTGSRAFVEIGRVDSLTAVDAVAFGSNSQQLFLARERESLVKPGADGLSKLFDPFVTNTAMTVREGAAPTFSQGTSAKSLTGGSDLEIRRVVRRLAAPDAQTFEAVRAVFDDKLDKAREILQQVIKDFPNYGEAQRVYAIFFEKEDLVKLQSALENSVKADPNCISCLRTLGDVQYKTDQNVAAATTYERVLQLKPEYGLVAGHLAFVNGKLALSLIAAGNTEKNMSAAVQLLNRALMLRPGEEQLYTNLGAVYYFRGDFDKDIELLMIAQKLRPDHARVYYNLGHAYRYKNDKQKAIEAYRRYVQMGEEGEEERVEKAKEFIKLLSK